jgi:hypothetical protein
MLTQFLLKNQKEQRTYGRLKLKEVWCQVVNWRGSSAGSSEHDNEP